MKWIAHAVLITATCTVNSKCLDKSVVADVSRSISVEMADVATFDLCEDRAYTTKIFATLALIRSLRIKESLRAPPFVQNILGTEFWSYFLARTSRIRLDERCRPGALAYVDGVKVDGVKQDGLINLCPDFFDDRVTLYERAETLLHEVRHFEGFSHVDCQRGPRRGEHRNCDESIEDLGSYAVTVEALAKMSRDDTAIAAVDRAMNKISALIYADEAFNEPVRPAPADLRAFYFEQTDGRAFIFDAVNSPREVKSPWPARLISRGFSLSVYPADRSDTFRADPFSLNLDPLPPTGWIAQDYNALPRNARQPVLDILNLGYLTGYAFGAELHARRAGESTDQVVPLKFIPLGFYSGAEVGRKDTDSIYITNARDEMWRVRFKIGAPPLMDPVDNPIAGLSHVIIFRGERLGLDQSGNVLVDRGGWTLYSPLLGRRVDAMTRPFVYDAYFY